MAGQPTPTVLTIPFARDAAGGYINTVPQTSQIGVAGQDGVASWPTGFPPLSMTAISGGGVAPRGQDFNGVLNTITQHIAALQAGQHYAYDSTVSTALSGYKKGALLVRSDGNGYWLNNTDGNTTDPNAGGANWTPVIGEGLYSQALTNANVTLTALQWARDVIVLTGTLTANVNVVFPAIVDRWLVVNQCTGAFSVTCKTASGTGTVISQGGAGAPTAIWCDGTNVYPAASVAFTAITNTPTTIAGYGITVLPWANVTGRPTTIAGYGITDAITTANIAAQSVAAAVNATNASNVPFTGISGKPTTIAGYGITDAITTANISAQSVSFAINANNAANVPFTGISGKPTTIAGYGITNAITTAGGQAIGGALTIANGDLTVYRPGGTSGVVYLRSDGGAYLYYDGSNITLQGGAVFNAAGQMANLSSPAFSGTPTCPTQPVATSNGALANTAFVNPSQAIGASGYVKLPSGLIQQWCSTSGLTSATQTLTFPISFPSNVFAIYTTQECSPTGWVINVQSHSLGNCTVAGSNFFSTNPTATKYVFAIGN